MKIRIIDQTDRYNGFEDPGRPLPKEIVANNRSGSQRIISVSVPSLPGPYKC